MDFSSDLSWIGISLKVFFIDVLLSGDNVVLIALACRGLSAAQARKAITIGVAGAIFFRVILAALAGVLMSLPFLRLAGAALLILIAINLLAGEYQRRSEGETADGIGLDPRLADDSGLLGAAILILLADAIMSLDNIVALAAVSDGSLAILMGGLLFSVPVIFFGSLVVGEVMQAVPAFILVGTGLLGWVAGGMIVSDPLWSAWIAHNAEAFSVLVPVAAALFVLVEGRITADSRRARTPKPVPPVQVPAVMVGTAMGIATTAAPSIASSPMTPSPVPARPLAPLAVVGPVSPARSEAAAGDERLILIGFGILACVAAIFFIVVLIAGNGLG